MFSNKFITQLVLWVLLVKEVQCLNHWILWPVRSALFAFGLLIPIVKKRGISTGLLKGFIKTNKKPNLQSLHPSISVNSLEKHFRISDSAPYAIRYKVTESKLTIWTIANKGLRPFFFMQRTLTPSKKLAHHDYLSFYPKYKGKGDAKKILKNCISFYGSCGIERVELKAGLSGGGAYWAKAGFIPYESEMANIFKKVEKNYKKLSVSDLQAFKKLTNTDLKQYLEDIKNKNRPDLIYAIRSIGPMIKYKDMSLGARLLMNTRWRGYLDLTDKRTLDILDDFFK